MAPVFAGELPQEVVEYLRGGNCTVLATASSAGEIHTTLMTWVVAVDGRVVRMAMDHRGQALADLRENPRVGLEVLGDDVNFGIRGAARVVKERMETVPFACAVIEMLVEEVSDHRVVGISFRGPSYSFVPGKEHRYQVEEKVFQELRGSTSGQK